jgi:integrase/recombinase XerC/integrase/recombinase XerD
LSEAITEYGTWLTDVRTLSARTVESYLNDLSSWEEFLSLRGVDLFDADRKTARSWLSLLSVRKMAGSSVNRRLSTLRGFYEYQIRQGRMEENPFREVKNIKTGRKLPRHLSPLEIEKLLSLTGEDFTGRRDRVLFELLFSTGCRVGELCTLDIGQIRKGTITVRGKGDRDRYVFVGASAQKALEDYLPFRKERAAADPDSSEALILDLKGKRLTPRGVYFLVEEYARKAGLARKIGPHAFRHSFATELLNEGADIRVVQELLGHVSLSTTQIYTHTGMERIRQVYRSAHPHAKKKGMEK